MRSILAEGYATVPLTLIAPFIPRRGPTGRGRCSPASISWRPPVPGRPRSPDASSAASQAGGFGPRQLDW